MDASASARTPCGLTDVDGIDPGDTWLDVALLFLREFFKHKILTSPTDEAAVVFYGARPVAGGDGGPGGGAPPGTQAAAGAAGAPAGTQAAAAAAAAAASRRPPPPEGAQAAAPSVAGPAPAADPVAVFLDMAPPSASRVRALTALIGGGGGGGGASAAAGGDPLSGPAAADAAVAALLAADAILSGRVRASGLGRGGGGGGAGGRVPNGGGGAAGAPPRPDAPPPPGRAATLARGLRRVIALTGDGLPTASAASKRRAVDRAAQMADRRIWFELVALAPSAAGGGEGAPVGGGVLGPRALRRAPLASAAQPFWAGVARRAGHHGAGAPTTTTTTTAAAVTQAGGAPPPSLVAGATQRATQAFPLPPPPPTAAPQPLEDAPSDDEGLADPESAVMHLRSVVGAARAAAYRRRALGTFDVRVPGGGRFGVSLYAAVRPASLGTVGQVFADTLEPVEVRARRWDADGREISGKAGEGAVEAEVEEATAARAGSPAPARPRPPPSRRARALSGRKLGDGPGLYCGAAAPPASRVLATEGEVAALRGGGPRGFTILGWAPVGPAVRPTHAMQAPSFLYPTRDTDGDCGPLPGGRAAAVALHTAMLGTEEGEGEEGGMAGAPTPARAALASFVRSPGSRPRLVALVARREVVVAAPDGGVSQAVAPGFDLIYLPWADDARRPEMARAVVGHPPFPAPPPGADAAADAVVAALATPAPPPDSPHAATFGGFTPVPNPVLQREYELLAALALGEPLPPGPAPAGGDATLPPVRGAAAASAASAAVAALLASCGAQTRPGKAKGVKRAGSASPDPAPLAASLARVQAGGAGSLTVAELKGVLRAWGLPLAGVKAALVARLEATGCERSGGGGGGGGGGGPAPSGAPTIAAPTGGGGGGGGPSAAPSAAPGVGLTSPSAAPSSAAPSPSVAGGGSGGSPARPRGGRGRRPPPPGGMEVEVDEDDDF